MTGDIDGIMVSLISGLVISLHYYLAV